MGVDFVSLANSTPCNISSNVGGHSRPPIFLLEQVEDIKYTAISTGFTSMDK